MPHYVHLWAHLRSTSCNWSQPFRWVPWWRHDTMGPHDMHIFSPHLKVFLVAKVGCSPIIDTQVLCSYCWLYHTTIVGYPQWREITLSCMIIPLYCCILVKSSEGLLFSHAKLRQQYSWSTSYSPILHRQGTFQVWSVASALRPYLLATSLPVAFGNGTEMRDAWWIEPTKLFKWRPMGVYKLQNSCLDTSWMCVCVHTGHRDVDLHISNNINLYKPI